MAIVNVTSNNRPSIFVASSVAGLRVAEAVKSNFDRTADVDIWTQNVFALNKSALDTLINRASFYDFAIFVLTPDDRATVKGQEQMIPRDWGGRVLADSRSLIFERYG